MNRIVLSLTILAFIIAGCQNNSYRKSTNINEIVSHLNKANFVEKYRGFRAEPRDRHNFFLISCDSLENKRFGFLFSPGGKTELVGGYNRERFRSYFQSRFPKDYEKKQREYIKICSELLEFMDQNNIAIIDGKLYETGVGKFQVLLYSNWDLIYDHNKERLQNKNYLRHFDSIYWVDKNWIAMESQVKTEFY